MCKWFLNESQNKRNQQGNIRSLLFLFLELKSFKSVPSIPKMKLVLTVSCETNPSLHAKTEWVQRDLGFSGKKAIQSAHVLGWIAFNWKLIFCSIKWLFSSQGCTKSVYAGWKVNFINNFVKQPLWIILLCRFAEQNLRDCRDELQSKTEELRSVLESSTITESELREEAKLRKRYMYTYQLLSDSKARDFDPGSTWILWRSHDHFRRFPKTSRMI